MASVSSSSTTKTCADDDVSSVAMSTMNVAGGKVDVANNGIRSVLVCKTTFEVPTRYRIIKAIGQGAYGIVCSAHDHETGEKVAIKKITKAFSHPTDTKRTLRELKLLRHFQHENVISLIDLLAPVPSTGFEDLYLVSELMDTDLHQIIRSPQELSDDHCQYFLYQIMRGMKYIHSAGVLHRDLKPSNLLLNANCDLKICDFGLARAVGNDKTDPDFMTEYVATRWYRAPEILLSWPSYSKSIDVWSIGCIFYELLDRQPLFPGKNYKHQVDLIIDVLGTPSEQVQSNIQSSKARAYVKALPRKEPQRWSKILPHVEAKAASLLTMLLQFDPLKRISVEEALGHPYLTNLHDADDEPSFRGSLDFAWDKPNMRMAELREMTYNEIKKFHPSVPEYADFIKVCPPLEESEKKSSTSSSASAATTTVAASAASSSSSSSQAVFDPTSATQQQLQQQQKLLLQQQQQQQRQQQQQKASSAASTTSSSQSKKPIDQVTSKLSETSI